MQQRVAICQSLIMKPQVLLLDEPFGALDETTRESLHKMLLHLYADNMEALNKGKEPPWTVVFITHSLDEAFYVSDRIIGLSRNWTQCAGQGQPDAQGSNLGATKVWDKCTPVYSPDAPKDFELFFHSKEELKEVVLNDKGPAFEREKHVSFWKDLENGVGSGVALTGRP